MERKRNNQQKTKTKRKEDKNQFRVGGYKGGKESNFSGWIGHGKGKTGSAKEDPSSLALDPCYPLPSRQGATRQTALSNR